MHHSNLVTKRPRALSPSPSPNSCPGGAYHAHISRYALNLHTAEAFGIGVIEQGAERFANAVGAYCRRKLNCHHESRTSCTPAKRKPPTAGATG